MELISFFNYKKKSNVIRAKNGDNDAFLTLINENRLNVYRVARGILKSEHDIEDAIQNTVVKAYEKINTLKKDEFFKTWLIRILINECNEIIRKNKKIENINKDSNEEKYNDYKKEKDKYIYFTCSNTYFYNVFKYSVRKCIYKTTRCF